MENTTFLFMMVVMLGSLGQVTADIYLPSIPTISQSLFTTTSMVQMSVATYMYGFALSQLAYGPLSDGIGRKKPLIFGLCVCVVGSLMCFNAHVVNTLIAGRLLQGLGAGAGMTLSRAIVRDIYEGEKLAKFASYLSMVTVTVMASAPLLGSYIHHYASWRSNFILLTLFSLIILVLTIGALPETNRDMHPEKLRIPVIRKNATEVLTHRNFMAYVLMILLTFAGILAWLTSGSVVLIDVLHLSVIQFGWIALLMGVVYAMFGYINSRVVEKFGMNYMINIGIAIKLLASIAMLILGLTTKLTLLSFLIPLAVFIASSSFILVNSAAAAMSQFSKNIGIAASICCFLQILGGAVASMIIAYLHNDNQIPMVWLFFVSTIATWIVFKFMFQPDQQGS